MAHLSGLILIDCPASALNNAGQQAPMVNQERTYENWSAMKFIRTRQGIFPYVSAQAFRYWMRESLKTIEGWSPSPMFREAKIAYTDANPILYAEDDLFGYMRAPGAEKKPKAKADKGASQAAAPDRDTEKSKAMKLQEGGMTALEAGTLTRVSPFKVSTLISIGPLRNVGFDYGTMSRMEGDPVPHVHEFYRTTLVGLFSLDLRSVGRFYHIEKTGFRNLDATRKKTAEDQGLASIDNGKGFELPLDTRASRVEQLLRGFSQLTGGAKLTLHYTDVTPKFLLMGVANGGNHLFSTAVGDKDGLPLVNAAALEEISRVYETHLLSPTYCGLSQGYLDEQRDGIQSALAKRTGSVIEHPVEAIRRCARDLRANAEQWLA